MPTGLALSNAEQDRGSLVRSGSQVFVERLVVLDVVSLGEMAYRLQGRIGAVNDLNLQLPIRVQLKALFDQPSQFEIGGRERKSDDYEPIGRC